MRKYKNLILYTTTFVAYLTFLITSCALAQSTNLICVLAYLISIGWISLFALANNWWNGGDDEDV